MCDWLLFTSAKATHLNLAIIIPMHRQGPSVSGVKSKGKMVALMLLNLLFLTKMSFCQVYVGTGVGGSVHVEAGNDVLVLGGLFPIHSNEDNQCGSILDLGVQRLEAMVLATQHINDDPDFLPGVTLAFEIRDTCTQANYALEQSLDYVSARGLKIGTDNDTVLGVSGVVGAASSSVSIAVANLLRLFRIPQISPASTAAILSDKSRFDYFFRTIPPDSLQARAMSQIIHYFNWTYVIAMHSDDAYGSDGIGSLIDELEKVENSSRVCVAASIELPLFGTASDFDSAVEYMNQEWVRNATVVVLFGQLATAIRLLEAVERRRSVDPAFASKNFTWIGSDAWGDQLPAELHYLTHGMLSVLPRSKRSNNFDSYFRSLHPLNYTANPWFAEYWESIFNCSLGNQSELKECNLANQTLGPGSGYRQNSKVTFGFDAVYAFAHAIRNLQNDFCLNSRRLCEEIVDTRSGGVAIKGDLLLKYLHNVSFSPGLSAEVIMFDANGDQHGGFLVKNLRLAVEGRYSFEIIGRWDEISVDEGTLQIFSEVEWNDGYESTPLSACSLPCGGGEYPEPVANQVECCWICRPCIGIRVVSTGLVCTECELGFLPNANRTSCDRIPLTFLTWTSIWAILIIIGTSIGITFAAFVIAVFIVYYKHPVIKACSRELSAVLLIGITLCYLLPISFIVKPAPWVCAIRRFGVGFCFALSYSALLVKTNRVHRIFNRSSDTLQTPPLISPQSQLFFTALVVAVQVVIAVVWLVVERPSIAYVYNDFTTELVCGESPLVGLSVSLGYNLILLLSSTYYAFLTRKVDENFSEAKFISYTMYALCLIWLCFIPTYFATASLGVIFQTVSLVVAIASSAFATLSILFVPKLYFLYREIRKDSSHSGSEGSYGRDRLNSVSSVNGMLLMGIAEPGGGISRKKSLFSGERFFVRLLDS